MDIAERLDTYLTRNPVVDESAFIHPRATVIGAVTLGPATSVWPGVVLRGDINTIEVGAGSNIQDNAVVHLADDFGVSIGQEVTVGHLALVHACRIGDGCLVGMHSTVLDGAEIGEGCLIGAHALITQGKRIPPGSLVLGSPARVVRDLSEEERAGLRQMAAKYRVVARAHRTHLERAGDESGP
ncbi:MAG: gamma carbonic anhydrase family protein [Opitutales bacterium]